MDIYKKGSRGEVVKQIQRALCLYPDGVFGTLTEEAVMSFQRENGMVADGIVGQATLTKLLPKRPSSSFNIKTSKRRITDLVVHCTASREGQNLTVEQIRKMHKKKGWSDIGYHYVIDINGNVFNGRDVNIIGAHVSGHNAHSIGIVYVGGLDRNEKPKDTRTDKQKSALLALLKRLKGIYPSAKISGHRDFSPDKNGNNIIEPFEWIKSCPCFNAKAEYSKL